VDPLLKNESAEENMDYKTIHYKEKEGIGFITLNRPNRANALSLELLEELFSCLKDISGGKETRVLIIKGAGKHFSAGHDMAEVLDAALVDVRHLFEACMDLMMLMQDIPQPVIAQVNGVATAAGCQLVAACDLALAEEKALFATPGVKIGLFCSTPMVALSRAIGRKRALEMLLTGKFISASEACEYGLINRVVPGDRLDAETLQLAKEISQYSRVVIGLGKQAFYRQMSLDDRQAYDYTREVISSNALMPDAQEGISAFFEKRPPCWKENNIEEKK